MTSHHHDDEALTVAVICSSPRHARGKVARIATFDREPHLGGSRDWRRRPILRGNRMERTARRRDESIPPGLRDDVDAYWPLLNEATQPLRCKLCGITRPEPSDSDLETIARQGMSSIELSQLRA